MNYIWSVFGCTCKASHIFACCLGCFNFSAVVIGQKWKWCPLVFYQIYNYSKLNFQSTGCTNSQPSAHLYCSAAINRIHYLTHLLTVDHLFQLNLLHHSIEYTVRKYMTGKLSYMCILQYTMTSNLSNTLHIQCMLHWLCCPLYFHGML